MRILALVVMLSGLVCGEAAAGAFYCADIGPRALSQGGAFAVLGDDYTTLYYNPAALSRIRGTRAELAVTDMITTAEFQREDDQLGPFEPVENQSSGFFIPHILVGSDFGSERTTFAFGLYAPFGPNLKFPADGAQRYSLIESNNQIFFVGAGMGFQMTDETSLGVSLAAVFVHIERSLAYSIDPLAHEDPMFDSIMYIEGDDISYSYGFGFTHEIDDRWTIGANYNHQVDIAAVGTMSGDLPLLGWPGEDDITINMLLPRNVRVGVARQSYLVTTEFNLVWNQWSALNEILIDLHSNSFANIPLDDQIMETSYQDTWSPRLGLSYQPFNELTLRTGYWYENSAVPETTANPTAVDAPKHAVTVGLTYATPGGGMELDLNYHHIFFQDRHITNSRSKSINPVGGASYVGNGYHHYAVDSIAFAVVYRNFNWFR